MRLERFKVMYASCLPLLSLFVACSDSADTGKTFEVFGVVHEVRKGGASLLVDHEEMPGYMPAMIMPFTVKDPSESEGLVRGSEFEFTYRVANNSSWIENLRPTGNIRKLEEQSKQTSFSPKPLEIGETLPDYAFIDDSGEKINLSDYRGKVVALTFVFTRCPVPEYCPAMMRNFNEVEDSLKKELRDDESWKLLTISFDPEFDTPEIMGTYGKAFGRDSENWSLLTSEGNNSIKSLSRNVGLKYGKQSGSILHNLRTVVLDQQGRIAQYFTDETWDPKVLTQLIRELVESN